MLNSEKSVKRQFVYDFRSMPKEATLGTLSSSQGSSFNGERIHCGLVTKKRGTGSEAHYHPDETFNYVLEGALKVNMDGQEFLVPKGCLLHIPPNLVHTAVATDDADAVYLVWRDRASEKLGKPVTIKA